MFRTSAYIAATLFAVQAFAHEDDAKSSRQVEAWPVRVLLTSAV